ncbi:MAG: hypothetical protein K0R84_1684, partial [Clostridia bacterium]|nr:hypothetical protein [Clostridia bacterium]
MYNNEIKRNKILAGLIITSILSFFIKEALDVKVQASSLFWRDGQTKVVMISIDYIDIQDIAENDYLSKLINKSCSAFISSRQIGKATVSNAKLSIGSTKRLRLSSNMVRAENFDAQLEKPYKASASGETGNVLYRDIMSLKHANKNNEYADYIGYLGD